VASRLSLAPEANVRSELKTHYRDSTTHVVFEPLDFLARVTRKERIWS